MTTISTHSAGPPVGGSAATVAGACAGCGTFTGWGRPALADQSSGPGVPVVLCPRCDPETDLLPLA